jgi:allophanate hydrolase
VGDLTAAAALDGGLPGLRRAYAAGLDLHDVLDEVLDRIERAADPAIWIDVEPRATLHAAADALGRRGAPDLPLWGVPFGVKDNIDVAGRSTTGGLPGRARVATATASVVTRLLEAGAIYVGKTNLDQLATGLVGTRSPYGTPRNPRDASLVPGGSSSGSAVAVARRQVTFALGTDTAGSGRVPAAMCGVVGVKGVPGSRPVDGIIPASPSIDCVSTFASSVADGLLVESVTGGTPWPTAVGSLRVALADGASPEDGALLARKHTVAPVDLAPFHAVGDLLYGGPWLADRTAALADLLAASPEGLDPVVAEVVAGGERYRGVEVFAAQQRLRTLRTELASWWDAHDVLVVPTVLEVPTLAQVAADPFGTNVRLGRNTTFANLLGLAAVAVPAPEGPGGLTVLGPAGHLGAVAAVAADLSGEHLDSGSSVTGGRHLVAVVGAHLAGQPLNHQLLERGADLVERTATASCYRLHRLSGGPPARPGLERTAGAGASIEVEVWAMDDAGLGSLVATVAPPLGIGSVELADGRWVRGFICESVGLVDATDITHTGGWRAHLASVGAGSG